MTDRLLTYKEASVLLGFPEGTLRTWTMQGKLKVVRFGRAVRFQESYINELISKGLGPNGHLQEVR